MATGTTIIDAALHALQALQEGQSHNTNQGTFALAVLNRMLDSMNAERLYVYQIVEEDHSWPGATPSRTIGPAANFNTSRPTRIEKAVFRDSSGYDWAILPTTDRSVWESVQDKDLAGTQPEILFYDTGFPTGTLYHWPVNGDAWTLRLSTWAQLASVATVGTAVSLPPGYEELLVWNLAERLWPTYPSDQAAPMIARMAQESRARVKSYNTHPTPRLRLPEDLPLGQSGVYDIQRDM